MLARVALPWNCLRQKCGVERAVLMCGPLFFRKFWVFLTRAGGAAVAFSSKCHIHRKIETQRISVDIRFKLRIKFMQNLTRVGWKWKMRARLLPIAIGLDRLRTWGPLSQPRIGPSSLPQTILNGFECYEVCIRSKNIENDRKILKNCTNRSNLTLGKIEVPHGQTRWKFTHGLPSILGRDPVYQNVGHGGLSYPTIKISKVPWGCAPLHALWWLL